MLAEPASHLIAGLRLLIVLGKSILLHLASQPQPVLRELFLAQD
jgi:hypothetical protein